MRTPGTTDVMPISAARKTDESSSPEMPPDPQAPLSEEQRRWIRDIAAAIKAPGDEGKATDEAAE
jgi:hypothetical protein